MNSYEKIYSRLHRKARNLGRDLLQAADMNAGTFGKARGSRILTYHGLCQRDPMRFNTIFLTRSRFESQLLFYKKYFNILSLDDYYQQRFSDRRFNICITFDDGLANNYNYVLPLLEKYQVPATFFITGIGDAGHDILWNDFLGIVSKYGPEKMIYKNEHYKKNSYNKYFAVTTGKSLPDSLREEGFSEKEEMMRLLYELAPFKSNAWDEDYWLQMNMEQIRKLSEYPLAGIGAHGYYHNDLARIPLHDAEAEMRRSKYYLEDIIQKHVGSLAFPYGSYTGDLVKSAKALGYTQLLTLDFNNTDDHTDPALRERLTINPFISVTNQLFAIIKGNYD